jgi:hypothetical protein
VNSGDFSKVDDVSKNQAPEKPWAPETRQMRSPERQPNHLLSRSPNSVSQFGPQTLGSKGYFLALLLRNTKVILLQGGVELSLCTLAIKEDWHILATRPWTMVSERSKLGLLPESRSVGIYPMDTLKPGTHLGAVCNIILHSTENPYPPCFVGRHFCMWEQSSRVRLPEFKSQSLPHYFSVP